MEHAHPKERPLITLYLNNLEIGGAESIFVELARGFIRLGYRVDFVLGQARGALLADVPAEARLFDLKAPNILSSIHGLVSYLHRESPAVILAITELTSLLVLLSRRLTSAKVIVGLVLATTISRHRRSPLKKKLERILVSNWYRSADAIISVSRGVASDFAEYTGIPLESICVIYNPVITPNLLAVSKASVDHPFFQGDHLPVILGVGRLSEAKNFSALIRAFAIIRPRIQSRLLILGEGEERPALENLIRSLKLTQDVSLPGFVSSPFPYMSKASVFVLSSLWEGLPGALIEALACGAPVISTDCPNGPAEILDGGKYGHLVPVDDVQALADAIIDSINGDHRKPPSVWLDQFRSENVIQEYLKALRLVA